MRETNELMSLHLGAAADPLVRGMLLYTLYSTL
jgi:hypothetical protein